MTHLDALNAMAPAAFAAALEGVFEHAPWVPLAAAPARPFATVTALHAALMDVMRQAGAATQLRFLRGHPPLSAAALAGNLTTDSAAEQAALGLAGLGGAAAQFTALSAAYESRQGFPFIICARRHTPRSVLRELERRIDNAPDQERSAALDEVFLITRLRLVARITGPGVPATTGTLSLGITWESQPAAGLQVDLLRDGAPLSAATTNAKGEAVLLTGEPLRIGPHELRLQLGASAGTAVALGTIPVAFDITAPEAAIHVTVAAAPGRYSVGF